MTFHEHDCAPCHAAREILDEIANRWDPPDNWSEIEAAVGPGTLRDEFLEVAADVLHRFPLAGRPRPGGRP